MFAQERSKEYIEKLKQFVSKTYTLDITSFSPAPRGYYGETWTVETAERKCFLKLVFFSPHMPRYEASFPILEFMNRSGIDIVSRIVKTAGGKLYTHFTGGVVGLFEFVEGEHTENYPLEELFRLLVRIYKLDTRGIKMDTEDFGLGFANHYEANLQRLASMPDDAHIAAAAKALNDNSALIGHWMARLKLFSASCKNMSHTFCITSSDIGGNVIVNDGSMTIIDWDYLRLAPSERDLWPYMQRWEQIDLANSVFKEQGFDCSLDKTRLAFYCYYSVFYYLNEFMLGLAEYDAPSVREKVAGDIAAFFAPGYWVRSCLKNADEIMP